MRPARDQQSVAPQDDLLLFVVEMSSERVIVFDASRAIVFQNARARILLDRYALPEEIFLLVGKIFAAIAGGKTAETFPGRICLHKEIDGRHWYFRFTFREGDQPLVVIYFTDASVSSRFDLNVLRGRHHLTRRETDVLRHLLDGLKNHEIAEELVITEQTVKDYLSSIYQKFAVPDRFALLRLLVRESPQ